VIGDKDSAGNGNNPGVMVATPEVKRLRASGPILILAILFVVGAFLSWYFTWFGRNLSDSEISNYLLDQRHPRHVQHALLQLQQRIERGDRNAKQWYPEVVQLAASPETEFRLTVGWLMGFDNKSAEFQRTLLTLVKDPEPIVRRNAALALVRFNDSTGRVELLTMLEPYRVAATSDGVVASTLKEGSQIARGTLLARISQPDGTMEIRSPLAGKVKKLLVLSGSRVQQGEALLTISPDEQSLWEALRGLSLIGQMQDLPTIERFAHGGELISDRVKQQAALTAKAIQSRANDK
jgi:hypothetical protein